MTARRLEVPSTPEGSPCAMSSSKDMHPGTLSNPFIFPSGDALTVKPGNLHCGHWCHGQQPLGFTTEMKEQGSCLIEWPVTDDADAWFTTSACHVWHDAVLPSSLPKESKGECVGLWIGAVAGVGARPVLYSTSLARARRRARGVRGLQARITHTHSCSFSQGQIVSFDRQNASSKCGQFLVFL